MKNTKKAKKKFLWGVIIVVIIIVAIALLLNTIGLTSKNLADEQSDGVLATHYQSPLKEAKTKSRDAKRLADMRSLKAAMELVFFENDSYELNSDECTDGDLVLSSDCFVSPLSDYLSIVPMHDPSGTEPCNDNSDKVCDYTYIEKPSKDSYKIYFYLEMDHSSAMEGELSAGLHQLTENGIESVK